MKILSAAQLGTDLPTAASLLKHHELFDMEVNSHSDIVQQVCGHVLFCSYVTCVFDIISRSFVMISRSFDIISCSFVMTSYDFTPE